MMQKFKAARRSVKLYGVSGVLAAALLLGGQPALPDDVGLTAAERQQQAMAAYDNNVTEDYGSFVVANGRGYAAFGDLLPLTRAMYVQVLNQYAAALPQQTRLYLALAPTAAAMLQDEPLADKFPDQGEVIDGVYKAVSSRFACVDLLPTLLAHKDEYLYFNTDHHWTAQAGYLAYVEICRAMDIEPKPLADYTLTDTGIDFVGSIALQTGSMQLARGLDHLYYYPINRQITYTRWDNQGQPAVSQGVYKDWYLKPQQNNKYAFFMGGDLPLIRLQTDAGTGRKLAIIKDSYANTVIPFLTEHFDEIYVIDPRNSAFNALDVIADNQIDEVLFLNYARVVCLPDFTVKLKALQKRVPVPPVMPA